MRPLSRETGADPVTLSQDVLDAMREWLTLCGAPMPPGGRAVRTRSDGDVLLEISRRYDGGVSAFIRDHEGRGGDDR